MNLNTFRSYLVKMKDLDKRIESIEQRNQRVELDKVWETSFTRKIIIAILTYFTVVLFFASNIIYNPIMNFFVN